ncbi:hypothetical protein HH212_12060 [Massilia forsythiae]|uniref:Uncharacterized protein n=1 Tax=Massilia forsythiae TaxID=2728020 RepID=A0A7Z2VWV4_9BURK|nr:hypothetical protein [Massilia forsythiae]QJE00664.1 hypothetical protein HH212_12060 [Massilia forsythiae]
MANRNNISNTTPSAILGISPVPAEAEAAALAQFNAAAAVNMTNGTFLVEDGAAYDQAHMRSAQLSSLLTLMRMEGAQNFRNLADGAQSNLMYLASHLAEEVEAMLPLAAKEQHGRQA